MNKKSSIETKLLESGRSPECFDCRLKSIEQHKHEKIKCNKNNRKIKKNEIYTFHKIFTKFSQNFHKKPHAR